MFTKFAPAVPGLASAVHLAATCDIDDQAALLSGWNQSYAQLSAGAFEGRIAEAWLDGVHLFVEGTSRRLHQRGGLPAHRLALGLPMTMVSSAGGPAVFCGASDWAGDARTGRFCTFSGAQGFEFFTPEGLEMAGMELDRDELMRLATPEEQALMVRVGSTAALHSAARDRIDGLRGFIRGAFEMLAREPGLLDNAAVRSQLRHAAQSNALEILVSAAHAVEEAPVCPQRYWALVAQARERVNQDPETPMTVAALCSALRVSRRTLQAAFQEVLGMAPAAFLRAERLAGARRALREAPTVTEAAAQWGFWHFSHFAQDYRRLFGELPSQTWRRLHGSRDATH